MSNPAFQRLEQALQAGGAGSAFEQLAAECRETGNYRLLFEARLMRKRHELGLPLVYNGSLDDIPAEHRRDYEAAFIESAREAGSLFLADGNIPAAWPFFRAIGDHGPVAQAIEQVQPGEGVDPVIEIAFLEGVSPYKGFQLLLAQYGTCRAISTFEQYPARTGREECARLLVRTVHGEVVERMKRAIEEVEGQAPETTDISDLIAGRDWLFGEYSYYVDTSHLMSVIRYGAELEDPETLRLALQLTDYGRKLSPHFQYRGDPPFENIAADYGVYLRALLGEDVEAAVAHFRSKAAGSDPEVVGTRPAQVFVDLLARLERYHEAIDASQQYLRDVEASRLACPTVFQLCQAAGDFTRLKELAQEREDLLSFAAGLLQQPNPDPNRQHG
jgi:hypothetical protein